MKNREVKQPLDSAEQILLLSPGEIQPPTSLCNWLASFLLSPVFRAHSARNFGWLLQRCVYKTPQGMRPCGFPFTSNNHSWDSIMVFRQQPSNRTTTLASPHGHHHSSFLREIKESNLPGVNILTKIPQRP